MPRLTTKSIKFQRLFGQIVALSLLTLGAFIVMIPLYWMVSTSLKDEAMATEFPPRWIPMDAEKVIIDGRERFVYNIPVEGQGVRRLALYQKTGPNGVFVNPDDQDERYVLPVQSGERVYTFNLHWENYPRAMTKVPFFRFIANSALFAFFVALGNVVSCTFIAYGFARFRAKGLGILFLVLLSTIMLPAQVTLIPQFVLFKLIGWYDTLLPIIIPSFFGNAWNVFLLRQFMMTLPLELDDAARIDGCGPLSILWHIILPQIMPALATVTIFTSLWAWNEFFLPLIYLQTKERFTVSMGLQQFNSIYSRDTTGTMAASTIVMLPTVIVFFFAQRLFIQGVVVSGIKG